MMTDGFKIIESIEEFLDHGYYHNLAFLKHDGDFKVNLLSIRSDDLMNVGGMISQIYKACQEKKQENEEINLDKTIEINLMKNFSLRYLWKENKEENNEEISIEYIKLNDRFTPLDDFPLDF